MSRKQNHGSRSEYNIVLLGALGVGKSALTVKYMTRRFIMEYDPYIEDVYSKQEDTEGQEIIVNIMDTYEKEDSNNLARYMKWADAVMVVYSITDRTSFDKARDCLCRVTEHSRITNKECPLTLVANKIDLERYRQISKADGQSLAIEFEGTFYECTAAEEYEFVEDIFHGVVHSIQRERGERSLPYQPLYISEEKYHRSGRPRSPRNSTEKKEDKSQQKKNSSSFKLFNKSFKIFN